MDLLVATVFARRGILEPEEIKYFLDPNLNNLPSPFLFEDMESVVERIEEAASEGEKVAVFGDRDADGITSTVLLVTELKSMGLDVSWRVPSGDESYGLSMEAAKKFIEDDVTLVITVDCGISSNAEIAYLAENGVDTIVLDHHIAGDTLPAALAIIDPKVEGSGYPFTDLAGCGVVAKTIWALRFAKTDLYGSEFILLHAEPGPGDNTSTIIHAQRLYNLMNDDYLVEEIPNKSLEVSQSRMFKFLSVNLPILVLDADTELKLLEKAFGHKVDIYLKDIRSELESVIPSVRGKSLLELSHESRMAKYSETDAEIETLRSLFVSYCMYKHPSLTKEYEQLLDLVSIGTVADLMPIKGENRILVKRGLKTLSERPRESLVPLLSSLKLINKPVTTVDLGWYLSPVINASGRLGCPDVAIEMLLSSDRLFCEQKAAELISLNKQRKKMGDEAWEKVKGSAKKSLESFGSKFVLVDTLNVSRGLTGALAARVLKEFNVPGAIVLSEAMDGRISGSMRSRESLPSRSFLSGLSDLLIDFGGHKCAGGFSLSEENLDKLKARIDEMVLLLDEEEQSEERVVDAVIPERYMAPSLIKVVELFEPYGEQNPALQFLMEGAMVEDCVFVGNDREKGNIKLTIRYGQYLWTAMYWGGAKKYQSEFSIGDRIKMVFRLGRNYWNGQSSLQLTVLDLEKMEEKG
jgi:single-stranded-DNA-specific exonuclease RecJ